eukprot:483218-Prymnesium_polylepis.1
MVAHTMSTKKSTKKLSKVEQAEAEAARLRPPRSRRRRESPSTRAGGAREALRRPGQAVEASKGAREQVAPLPDGARRE